MKEILRTTQLMLILIIAAVAVPVQAGPSCGVRPNHPNCEPGDGDPGPVYRVHFSNIVTGTAEHPDIFTTPGTLSGEETGLNANSNGPNEVRFILYDFLTAALGTEDFATCFPLGHRLSGSIQLQDNSASGGDPDRVGYIWVHAFDTSSEEMPYAIDLFDLTGSWFHPLLPSLGETSTRTVTHWRLRRTKKKSVAECVSDGFVQATDSNFIITVEEADTNPWYE